MTKPDEAKSPNTNDTSDIQQLIDFQFDVLRRYDQYIGTTNFKVGLQVSFLTAVIAALLLRFGGIENASSLPCLVRLAIIFNGMAALAAIFFLLQSNSPKTPTGTYKSFLFFGDVAGWEGGAKGYQADFSSSDEKSRLQDLCCQSHAVAEITLEKFRLIGIATKITLFVVLPLLACNILIFIAGDF